MEYTNYPIINFTDSIHHAALSKVGEVAKGTKNLTQLQRQQVELLSLDQRHSEVVKLTCLIVFI
jgi:hypothetical protein